ncbi:hypothetical protein [Novilysobacter antarcticus]|uniref:hypothetical protein n=1 Tax=Novilysobacter antarcticus TaxID=2862543 RepID=UPI001C99F2B2|nr:hypothetical protein [Lysobacter antarcticus]
MPWILLAAAVVALIGAFKTTSVGVLALCLLLSFGLAVTALVQLLARRVAERTRDERTMIDPVVLAQLRSQVQTDAPAERAPPQ